MKIIITILFLIIGIASKAQFPFEKYQQIQYQKSKIGHGSYESDSTYIGISNINDSLRNQNIYIFLSEKREADSTNISIHRNDKIIQSFIEPFDFSYSTVPDSISFGDINNDGFIDIKIVCSNNGNGLSALLNRKIYLIGKSNGKFKKISFMDFFDENERDFNDDNIYEIIGIDHTQVDNHNYWLYNIYNIKNDEFKNVSSKYNYPILIQHLKRQNFTITDKVSKDKMKEMIKPYPRYYDERK